MTSISPSSPDLSHASLMQAFSKLPDSELAKVAAELSSTAQALSFNSLAYYRPYPKQTAFHAAGLTYRERLLMAANQVGKTKAGGSEVAMHLTGQYPANWKGLRFEKPVRWIAGSETAELTKKGIQRVMLGPPEIREQWGTGTIPRDTIEDTAPRTHISDAVLSVTVKHVSGGRSVLQLASYDQGRERWQADTVDGVWFDEEPPADIYSEGITRTNTTLGPVIVTFTPLQGRSAVVIRFLSEDSPDRHVTTMTLEDADHFTPEQRAKIIASYPEHERAARTRGEPMLGSGLVFPVLEEDIAIAQFQIPRDWPAIGGLDFGWDHPTAAVKIRWDRDADRLIITHCHRQRQQLPVFHAAALKSWGKIPWAWPHDGLQHDKTSGLQLSQQYRSHGLDMLEEHATHEEGGSGVEAGIAEIHERMKTGRFKVFAHLTEWFEEQRGYHRKDGLIVKERDDLMSATRYAVMMKRFAKVYEEAPRDRYGRGRSGGGSSWAA